MSFILDALKKAEQERGSTQLQSVASGRADRSFDRNRWRPFVLAFVVCLVGILCFFWLYQGRSRDITSVPRQPETRTDSMQAIVPSSDLPKSDQSAVGASPVSSATPLQPTEQIPVKPAGAVNYSNALKTTPIDPKPNEPAPSIPPNGRTAPVQTQQAAALEISEPATTSLREATSKMKVTMLMFSDNPSERIVFINSHKYKEGEYVEGRYRLDKIALDGVELSFKGERIFIRP
jgi:general secretion pathway protein B